MNTQEFIDYVSTSGETWRDVVGFKSLYLVSNYGHIISLPRLVNGGKGFYTTKVRLLTPHVSSKGYLNCCLNRDGHSTYRSVHRIVAEAFIPNPDYLPEIDHIDTDRTNNHVSNLRWCSRSENFQNENTLRNMSLSHMGCVFSDEQRLKLALASLGRKFSNESRAKISKALSKPVRQIDLQGNVINTFPNARIAATKTGVSFKHISACIHGRQHTSGGFYWELCPLD